MMIPAVVWPVDMVADVRDHLAGAVREQAQEAADADRELVVDFDLLAGRVLEVVASHVAVLCEREREAGRVDRLHSDDPATIQAVYQTAARREALRYRRRILRRLRGLEAPQNAKQDGIRQALEWMARMLQSGRDVEREG